MEVKELIRRCPRGKCLSIDTYFSQCVFQGPISDHGDFIMVSRNLVYIQVSDSLALSTL